MKNIYTPIIIAFLALFMFFEQAQAHVGESGNTMNGPTPSILTAVGTNPSACGAADGKIDFTFLNVPPGTHILDHSSGQLSVVVTDEMGVLIGSTATVLTASTYDNITITIPDCGTSMEDINVELTNPTPTISVTDTQNPSSCGASDGSVSFGFVNVPDGNYDIVHASGTFLNTPVSGGSAIVSNLSVGDYSSPSITYNGGTCMASSGNAAVLAPPGPTISSATGINPSSCGASDGRIDFTFTNVPDGTYNLTHSSGQLNVVVMNNIGSTAMTLSATTYNNITITTACGTSMEDIDVALTNPIPTISIINKTNPTTCGGSDGSITFSFTNVPDGNYNINHDSGTFLNTPVSGGVATVINLSSGDYSNPNISYNNATCAASSMDDGVLTSPPGPTISAIGTDPTICNGTNGRIDFTFTGVPNGDYFLDYNNGSQLFVSVTNNGGSVIGLGTSTYNNIRITVGSCTSTDDPTVVLVAPNPPTISVTDMNNPSTCGGSDGNIQLNLGNISNGNQTFTIIYGANGVTEGSFQVSTSGNSGNTTSPPLSAGTYTDLRFTTPNGCTSTDDPDVTLMDPGAPNPNISKTDPTSCNTANGQITIGNLSTLTTYDVSYEFNNTPVMLNNQAAPGGQININGLAAGAYTNITVTPSGILGDGCTSSPQSVTLNPPSPPVATLSSSDNDNTICNGDAVTFTAGGGVEYDFLLNGGSVQNDGTNTYTTTNLASGDQVSVIVTAANDCTDTSTPITTTVNQASPPTGGTSQSFCDDSNPTLASILVNGDNIRWYANSDNTNLLPNSTPLTDNTTYYATQMQNGCESTGNLAVTVTVDEAPNAGTGGMTATVCNNGETVNLNALITGEDLGGQWADTNGSGVSLANTSAVSFSGVPPGNYTFTYTVTGLGACSNLSPSSTTTVVVTDALISSSASADNPIICSTSSELINLNGTIESGSGMLTGIWSGGQGSFGNVNVGNTTYTRGSNEFGPVTLRWSIFDPCENETVMHDVDIQINAGVTEVEAGNNQSTCGTQSTDPLGASVSLDNGQSGTGMWSGGQGIFSNTSSPNATYMPSPTEIGSDVTLTWTADDPDGNGPCQGGQSDNVVISVTDVVTGATAMTSTPTICSDGTASIMGGATSPDGTAVSSGMWSGGSGIFANANDPETTYTPGSNEFNTVSLTWTVTDACTGTMFSASIEVQINAAVEEVSTGVDKDVCGIMATPPLGGNVTLANNQQGSGSWSGGQGAFSNANSPNSTYTPSNNEIGTTVTLTWTANDPDANGPCMGGQSSTINITVSDIIENVEASVQNATICSSNSASIMGVANLQGGSTSTTGEWVGGNGSFVPSRTSANATYTPSSGEAGTTVPLTWQVIDPCTNENLSASININVSAAITEVTASATNGTVCSDQSITLTASVELADNSNGSGSWSGGTGTFEDEMSGNTTYTLGDNEVAGNITLTWTPDPPASPCPTPPAIMVGVQISPEATMIDAGDDQLICSTNADGETNEVSIMGTVSLANGLDGNGSWSGGNGTLSINGNGGFNYTPASNEAGNTVTLTWTANDPDGPGPCNGGISDELDIMVNNGVTTINAGNHAPICFDENANLLASATLSSMSSFLEGTWTTNGDGEFGDETLNQTSYQAGGDDADAPIVLTWTSADPDGSGPCVPLSDALLLTINELPAAPVALDEPEDNEICSGEEFPTLDVSVANTETETVNWYNADMGGNPLNGGMQTTSFSPPSAGTYYAETINVITGCTSENGDGRTELPFIIHDLPSANFTQQGFLNPFVDIFFTDQSMPSDPEDCIVEWTWDFGEDASLGPITVTEPFMGEEVQYSSAGDKFIILDIVDKNGCIDQHTTTLPISNQTCGVLIGTVSDENQACQGSTVSFTITDEIFSSGANAWERLDWSIGGVLHDEHTRTINVTFDTPGTYEIQLEAEDNSQSPEGHCTVLSNTINVTIDPLPTGDLVVETPSICTGNDAQVFFDLTGSENTTFDVLFTTGLIEGYDSGSTISFSTPPGPITYNVLASTVTDNQTGCSNNINSAGEIIVNSNPEIEVMQPCPVSSSTPLQIQIEDGTAPFNITLEINENIEEISTSDNPYTTPTSYDNGTEFSIFIEDANGCFSDINDMEANGVVECECETVAGNINTTPINTCVGDPVTIIPPDDSVLDPDDVLNYRVEGNGVSELFSSPIITFNNSLFLPGVVYTITPIAGNDDGEGKVDLGHPCTVESASSVEVTWHALPTASINIDRDSICPGESLELSISFEGTFDNYDIEITEIKSDNTTSILPNTQNIDVNPFSYTVTPSSESTTYVISELSYDDNNFSCTQINLDTVIVGWYNPPVIDGIEADVDTIRVQNPVTFMPSITLGSSNEIISYDWIFPTADIQIVNPPLNNSEETVVYPEAGDQTITLTIVDGNGCQHDYTETVSVVLDNCIADFNVSLSGTTTSADSICIGEEIQVNSQNLSDFATVSWTFGNNSTPDGSTSTTPPPVSYTSAGDKIIILVVHVDELTCTSTDTITVLETPDIDLNPIDETELCQNHQIRYLADLGNTFADSLIWTLKNLDGEVIETTITTIPTLNVNWGASGTLSVEASNVSTSCTNEDELDEEINLQDATESAVDIRERELVRISRDSFPNTYVFAYPEENLCYKWFRATRAQLENGRASEDSNVSPPNVFDDQYIVVDGFDLDTDVVWVAVRQPNANGDCNMDDCANYVFSENDIPTIGLRLAAPPAAPGLALELYPNPNNGNFQLALKGDQVGRFHINIFDNIGRLLKQQVLDKEVPRNMIESIQLDRLNNGIYFLQVVDEQGESNVIRFVVQQQY